VLAIIISLIGMLVGALVLAGRLVCSLCSMCKCNRLQATVEMMISLLLLLIFAAAVALITGIGGPGQVVGDLYYSTWLAFFVSIGIFVACSQKIRSDEREISPLTSVEASMNAKWNVENAYV
jgi:hypothetical protein